MSQAKPDESEYEVVMEYDSQQITETSVDKYFRDQIQAMFTADEDRMVNRIVISNEDGSEAELDFEIRILSIKGRDGN